MIKERIQLAEAMGWHRFKDKWQPPSVTPEQCQSLLDAGLHINWAAYGLPDPFTDANDCEALIRFLQEKGYDLEIWWSGTAYTHRTNVNCRVKKKFRSDWETPKEGRAFDDWKQGICELALEVINDS